MAKIVVNRKNVFIEKIIANHQYIYIDGEEIDELRNAESKSFEITAGNHTLQIKSKIFRVSQSPKIKFTVSDGEEKSFNTSLTYLGILLYLITLAILLIIMLSYFNSSIFGQFSEKIYSISLLWFIPIVFIGIYAVSKSFLKIKEITEFVNKS